METRSHLRWAVRIIPVRKTPQRQELKLADLLDLMDKSVLKEFPNSFPNSVRERSFGGNSVSRGGSVCGRAPSPLRPVDTPVEGKALSLLSA